MEEFEDDFDGNDDEQMQRVPSEEKKVENITEDDNRVSVIGKVVELDKDDYTILLDDKTDAIKIEISGNAPELDQYVRVIGRVQSREDEIFIQSEILQDFSEVNIEKLNKIKELENEAEEVLEGF